MRSRATTIAAGAVVAAVAVGGGVAWATGGDEEQPLTGKTRARAVAAALAHTGGGTVKETEAGDDGAAYGVEVKLPDGRKVEIELDASFHVIGSERDDDGRAETDEAGDD